MKVRSKPAVTRVASSFMKPKSTDMALPSWALRSFRSDQSRTHQSLTLPSKEDVARASPVLGAQRRSLMRDECAGRV